MNNINPLITREQRELILNRLIQLFNILSIYSSGVSTVLTLYELTK